MNDYQQNQSKHQTESKSNPNFSKICQDSYKQRLCCKMRYPTPISQPGCPVLSSHTMVISNVIHQEIISLATRGKNLATFYNVTFPSCLDTGT